MTDLSTPQRALLDFLLAYHPAGLTTDQKGSLPEAARCDLDALRERGLVELRFVPIRVSCGAPELQPRFDEVAAPAPPPAPPLAVGTERLRRKPRAARSAPTPAPLPPEKARTWGRPSSWTRAAKERFLVALERGDGIRDALVAAGFPPESRGGGYNVKHQDPEFSRRWDRALAARKSPAKLTPPALAAEAQDAPEPLQSDQPEADPPAIAPPRRPRRPTAAEISEAALERQKEQARIEALRPPMDVDEARLTLQRKGRVVHRASVTGGRNDRWIVSGFPEEIDDTMLIAEAKRVEERGRR